MGKSWFYITAQDDADSHFGYHCKRIEGPKLQEYLDGWLAKQKDAKNVRAFHIPFGSLKPDFFNIVALSKRPF